MGHKSNMVNQAMELRRQQQAAQEEAQREEKFDAALQVANSLPALAKLLTPTTAIIAGSILLAGGLFFANRNKS